MKLKMIAAVGMAAVMALSLSSMAEARGGFSSGGFHGGGGRSFSSSSSFSSRSYSSPSYSSSRSYSSPSYSSPSYSSRSYSSGYQSRPLNTPAYRPTYGGGYRPPVVVHHYGYGYGGGGFWNGYMMASMFNHPMYVMPGGGYSATYAPGYVQAPYNPVAAVIGWLVTLLIVGFIIWLVWFLFFRNRYWD